MTNQLPVDIGKYQNLVEKVKKQGEIIVEMQNAIIQIMSDLIDCRDNNTGGHVSRISSYIKIIAEELVRSGHYKNETHKINVEILSKAALLHDIGKIAIPDAILRKDGKLSEEEFQEMKNHTIIGAEAIEKAMAKTRTKNLLPYAKIIALSHHEKWDGSGYPYKLREEKIPLIGRLTAIVDVYDALVSARAYKPPFSHDKAVKIIEEGSGTHFDAKLCEIFFKWKTNCHSYFVTLNNDRKRTVNT